eukprot:10938440-Lingulodinium_polyedra.AAC.1
MRLRGCAVVARCISRTDALEDARVNGLLSDANKQAQYLEAFCEPHLQGGWPVRPQGHCRRAGLQ